jgi:hypothetical protein
MVSGFLSGIRRLLGRSSPPDGPPISSPGSVLIVFDGADDSFKKKPFNNAALRRLRKRCT